MTLHRHWPEVDKMLVTINPFAAPVERWHTDPEFRTRVLEEWRKIEPYREKGSSSTGRDAACRRSPASVSGPTSAREVLA